jgi:hypothetical protein
VRLVYPDATELEARAAVHAVFGLLNSTPHLGGQSGLPDRAAMAGLLRRLAHSALDALGERPGPPWTAPTTGG